MQKRKKFCMNFQFYGLIFRCFIFYILIISLLQIKYFEFTPQETQTIALTSLSRFTPTAEYPELPFPTPHAIPSPKLQTLPAERALKKSRNLETHRLPYHPRHFSTPFSDTVHSRHRPIPSLPHTQMLLMESQTYPPTENLPPPQQGYLPFLGRYQRPQMQTEHHDYLMSLPQPQVNPPGPKVYQVPSDYSTLPGY